ncbi:MAG: hypothetical protein M3Q39_09985 [Actinomycetota bacterium]|nr:hypothetical protein [Actinomycetota bacterium]
MVRYEEAIEADLRQRYHEDLGDLWRGRRWRYLANLISHLPRNSHLRQEQLNDPEYVGLILEAQEKAPESNRTGMPVSEFSPEVATLEAVGNDIRNLVAVIQSALGASGRPTAYDGASTVVQKIKAARRLQKHQRVLDMVEAARERQRKA